MRVIKKEKAQTAIEYMLLLASIVAIVLIGFNHYLPRFYETSNIFYNRAAAGIYGKPPRCGDGICGGPSSFESSASCPADCF